MAIEAVKGYSGIGGSEFGGTADAPLDVPIPPDGHDRGIALHPEEFPRVFEQLKGRHFMAMNEYIAYLHAQVSLKRSDALELSIDYDQHYCRAFSVRSSEWVLEVPGVEGQVQTTIDGNTKSISFHDGIGAIPIPPGLKKHTVVVQLPE